MGLEMLYPKVSKHTMTELPQSEKWLKSCSYGGADFVALILEGGDPNGVNKSVDELIAVVKDVADSLMHH